MKKILIVVDMQNDFIDGSLGTEEAQMIVPAVCKKIRDFDGEIIATLDTHFGDYLNTCEGKNLPVMHCIEGTHGHNINKEVKKAMDEKGCTYVKKSTFGSTYLPELIMQKCRGESFCIELLGLCTDICVVSNALLLKAYFPNNEISVIKNCCAGVTVESHNSALTTMKSCQINIV